MENSKLNRRDFLQRAAVLGAAAVAGSTFVSACKSGGDGGGSGGFSCTDTTGLTDAEKSLRESLNYIDASTNAEQNCLNCQLYTPAAGEGQCGGCTLIKGPIHPEGWCSSWAAAT